MAEQQVRIPEPYPYMIRINADLIRTEIAQEDMSVRQFGRLRVADKDFTEEENQHRFYSWLTQGKMPFLQVMKTAQALNKTPHYIVIPEDHERLWDRMERYEDMIEAFSKHDLGVLGSEALLDILDRTLPYVLPRKRVVYVDRNGNKITTHARWKFLKERRRRKQWEPQIR